jgi:hypothetical protein
MGKSIEAIQMPGRTLTSVGKIPEYAATSTLLSTF